MSYERRYFTRRGNMFFKERKGALPAYIVTLIICTALMFIMNTLQDSIASNHYIDSLDEIIAGKNAGDVWSEIQWLIGEIPEGQVMRTWVCGVVMIIFTFIGYFFERTNSRFRGTDLVGGSGYFIPMLLVSTGAMLLANLVYHRATMNGWAATFISFCSLAPLLFTIYGGGAKKIATEMILGGLAPAGFGAYIAMPYIVKPLGLPAFVSAAIGMAVTVPLCVLLCRHLPWMTPIDMSIYKSSPADNRSFSDSRLYVRRLLADPSELIFWGSSWGTVGMYIGAVLAWWLDPLANSCAAYKFPTVMCCQLITVATSIFLWFPKVKRGESAFTFSGFVIISAFINTYEMSVSLMIISILVAAVFTPLTAMKLYEKTKLRSLPPCCSTLTSFCIVCISWSLVLRAVTM